MTGQQNDIDILPEYIKQLKDNTPSYLIEFSEHKYKPSDLGISAPFLTYPINISFKEIYYNSILYIFN